jgi:hypothetical protein
MRETYDLSLKRKYAGLVLRASGKSEGRLKEPWADVVKVTGTVGDEFYTRARTVFQDVLQSQNESIVRGCAIKRHYTKKEIDAAELFLVLSPYQYGAAEEYGTRYTDAPLRPDCGIDRQDLRVLQISPFRSVIEDKKNLTCALGSRQVGPLHYPFGKLTKRDLISLWGGETVVSERFAELIECGRFRGGRIEPIWNTASGAKALPVIEKTPTGAELIARAGSMGMRLSDREFWMWVESAEQLPAFEKALWEEKKVAEEGRTAAPPSHRYFQLMVDTPPLVVAEQTVLVDPFIGGSQHQCKCELGEIYARIFSRLYVKRSTWDGSDICQTDLYFGGRQGLFRPFRHLMVSKSLFDRMNRERIKKVQFKIVELV